VCSSDLEDGFFYFLEMNTRLQVEHPVTELVNGMDLVKLQLEVASGQPLPLAQQDVALKGWAIEVRVCAEDPKRGFVPSVGLITRYAAPRGENVRVDAGVDAGSTISVYYDPMLAKVITWGDDREEARKRMVQALNGYHVEGIHTNIDFANQVLTHPVFISGNIATDFIPTYLLAEGGENRTPVAVLHAMALATTLIYHLRESLVQTSLIPLKPKVGATSAQKSPFVYVAKSEQDVFPVVLQNDGSELQWQITVDGEMYQVVTPPMEYYRRRLKLTINGEEGFFRLTYSGNFLEAAFCGVTRSFEIYNTREWELAKYMPPPTSAADGNILDCPMPGLVVEVKAAPGERVYRGQELIILESMKMESAVAAPKDGVVAEVCVTSGDAVETGSVLIRFK
jgi:propionyl-CoA carboxylase alpha chain